MAAVGRHHRRGAAALRPRHVFCGLLCSGYEYRVDVVELVVDLVDFDLNVGLVDADLDGKTFTPETLGKSVLER